MSRDYRPNTPAEKVQALLMTGSLAAALLIALVMAAACAVPSGAVVTPAALYIDPQAVMDCRALWQDELGREIDHAASDDCASFLSRGLRTLEDYRVTIRAGEEYAAYRARLDAEKAPRARTGVVAIAGRTFIDAQGPWLALGASHFSSGWLYLHDRAKFDRELQVLRGLVDFVRSFVLVGPSGKWEDRTLGVGDLGMVAPVTDAHFAAGFRTEWTIFAGVDQVPTPDARLAVVDRVCVDLQPRQEKIQFLEVANEGWQNGFGDDEGRAELHALVARLRACLPQVQVAPTAPPDPNVEALYGGSQATLATAHLERDINGTGGPFRPIRQAREFAEQPWPWVSNEPIGPQASVAADDDPSRLTLSAVYTWLCRGAAYVYHAGAGIRSGGAADLARGRSASFDQVPHFRETLERMQAARAALPADLPNWTWVNSNGRYGAYPFQMPYTAPDGTRLIAPEEQLLRAFASLAGDGRFVVVPLRVTEPTAFVAARAMTFEVRPISNPVQVIASVSLAPGQSYTLPAMPGALFIGRFQ